MNKKESFWTCIISCNLSILEHKRKIIEYKGSGSGSLTEQNQMVHIEKDIELQDGHGHVSVKVSKVQTPSQSTITQKETVVETERKTSDGEVFR